MRGVFAYLETQSSGFIFVLSLMVTAFLGVADYFAGPEISSAIFYIIPVGIAAWYGGAVIGAATSITAALTWLMTDVMSGAVYTHPAISYWNSGVRLALFLLVAYLLYRLRERLEFEETLAGTDGLTGALNSRAFYKRVEDEVQRFRRFRHPFSIAYIDLDNFKTVNDTHGHTTGDELLRSVVAVIKANSRRIDLIARLGGDEFTILFLETGASAVLEAVEHLRCRLLEHMASSDWPVTFSIGVVTFEAVPDDIQQIIKLADDLMYEVKKKSKNGVLHTTWKGATGRVAA